MIKNDSLLTTLNSLFTTLALNLKAFYDEIYKSLELKSLISRAVSETYKFIFFTIIIALRTKGLRLRGNRQMISEGTF